MTLVFQYGSNLSSERINSHERLRGDARVAGVALTTEHFHLDFTVHSRTNGCAAADIVPTTSGRRIWGVLYAIPPELVFRGEAPAGRRSLDEIESNYERIEIDVTPQLDHALTGPVLTYVVRERRRGLRTAAHYAAHILRGLQEHGAPGEYVDYVRTRIAHNNPTLANVGL